MSTPLLHSPPASSGSWSTSTALGLRLRWAGRNVPPDQPRELLNLSSRQPPLAHTSDTADTKCVPAPPAATQKGDSFKIFRSSMYKTYGVASCVVPRIKITQRSPAQQVDSVRLWSPHCSSQPYYYIIIVACVYPARRIMRINCSMSKLVLAFGS